MTGKFLVISGGFPTAARKDARGRLVGCSEGSGIPNSNGQRVGGDHHNALLTDAQVDEIRDRYEAFEHGHPQHEGYRVLASAYGVSKRTIRDIVVYRRRVAYATRWKRVDK